MSARISISAISNGESGNDRQPLAALLPLPLNPRMPIQKRCNQIRLVAVHIAGFAPPDKISQQRFGNFRVGFRRKRTAPSPA